MRIRMKRAKTMNLQMKQFHKLNTDSIAHFLTWLRIGDKVWKRFARDKGHGQDTVRRQVPVDEGNTHVTDRLQLLAKEVDVLPFVHVIGFLQHSLLNFRDH